MTGKPFAPLYIDTTDSLLERRLHTHLRVVQVLANRANELGVSYAGDQYIGRMAACAPKTVATILDDLVAWDWLKIHCVQDLMSTRVQRYTQLSPKILFIAEEHRLAAWALWNQGVVMSNVNFDIQPDRNQNQEPTPKPDSEPDSNHHHQNQSRKARPPAPAEKSETEKSEKPQGADSNSAEGTKPPAAQPQPTSGETATDQPPPGSAPPPPPDDKSAFEQPLPGELETLAHQVKAHAPTLIWQARRLVSQHDTAQVRAGLTQLQAAMLRGNVKNPFGLLHTWLREGIVDPAQDASITVGNDGSEFVNGKYRNAIKWRPEDE